MIVASFFWIFAILLILSHCKMSILGINYIPPESLRCLWNAGYLDESFLAAIYSYTTDTLHSVNPSSILEITETKPFMVLTIQELKYERSPDL